LGGERIDIVPWHAEPEVFARRSLAPAKVSKVLSDPDRRVITAIVDEDQLSLAIGRNGQNVRLASQLIGWQIDLYGSREWLELGADLSLFKRESADDAYETSDFSLSELDLGEGTLAALHVAGYNTFLQIIDFDRASFLAIDGLGEEEADQLVALIDELTVVADPAEEEAQVEQASAGTEPEAGPAADPSEDDPSEEAAEESSASAATAEATEPEEDSATEDETGSGDAEDEASG
jgi:N utilization substance protein A